MNCFEELGNESISDRFWALWREKSIQLWKIKVQLKSMVLRSAGSANSLSKSAQVFGRRWVVINLILFFVLAKQVEDLAWRLNDGHEWQDDARILIMRVIRLTFLFVQMVLLPTLVVYRLNDGFSYKKEGLPASVPIRQELLSATIWCIRLYLVERNFQVKAEFYAYS